MVSANLSVLEVLKVFVYFGATMLVSVVGWLLSGFCFAVFAGPGCCC